MDKILGTIVYGLAYCIFLYFLLLIVDFLFNLHLLPWLGQNEALLFYLFLLGFITESFYTWSPSDS